MTKFLSCATDCDRFRSSRGISNSLGRLRGELMLPQTQLIDRLWDILGCSETGTRPVGSLTQRMRVQIPRHKADANLGATVDEVGFTIVHKSASVLSVFQTRGFRATVLHGDCPSDRSQSHQRATGRVFRSSQSFEYRERLASEFTVLQTGCSEQQCCMKLILVHCCCSHS